MIEISHLTKQFGPLKAVDDVSLDVAPGEVLGFLGPNGAGKSTTMKMITGFLAPDSGRVTVAGDDVATSPMAVKRRIGYLPEGAPLYGDMTPRGFLEFVAEIRGFKGAERRRRVERAVELTSLHGALEKPIETLSKGFKRRVGLAQAILHDPEVLVLDEPTDGLDPNQKHEVRELIRTMAPDKVIVLSTHILEEVEAVCTRATIIASGRLVFDGTPDELMARSSVHNAVTLSVEGAEADAARAALAALDGVAEVVVLDGADGRLTLQARPADGASLAAPVSALARDRGWHVHALSVERGRLDEVFRDITAGRARDGEPAPVANIIAIFKRELGGYFTTPIAYVFAAIFVFLSGVFAFYLGSFFERGQADLVSFFQFHPWLYLFLIPALAMRLWAEERRSGTVELLMTLPVSVGQAVIGKFLAAWCFAAIALALTFPMWITVNYLGNPDNGVIVASYLGSLLMAGSFLAIGSCVSALTRNQVIAFVVSAVICLVFVLAGYPLVLEFVSSFAPDFLVETVASFSFLAHFNAISKGVIEARDIVYFVSLIAFWLFANAVIVDLRKAD